jgi:hypothetical protein
MTVRKRLQSPAALTRIGMLALLIGLLLNRILHPTPAFSENLIDGARGVLYGISAGCLLLANRTRHRPVD